MNLIEKYINEAKKEAEENGTDGNAEQVEAYFLDFKDEVINEIHNIMNELVKDVETNEWLAIREKSAACNYLNLYRHNLILLFSDDYSEGDF